jgi:hypothetical protein
VTAQTVYQASEPYPLVHITPWSPSIAPGEALASASVASRRNSFVDGLLQIAIGRSSYWPPRVKIAKTMRATLLASATAVSLNLYLTALRASSEEAHTRSAS